MIVLYDLLLFYHNVLVWDFYGERTPQISDKLIQNSCYSTPVQDTNSTSLRAVTIHLYWIRPLVFLISNLGKKKFLTHSRVLLRQRHPLGKCISKVVKVSNNTFSYHSEPSSGFLLSYDEKRRKAAGFSCFVPTTYIKLRGKRKSLLSLEERLWLQTWLIYVKKLPATFLTLRSPLTRL